MTYTNKKCENLLHIVNVRQVFYFVIFILLLTSCNSNKESKMDTVESSSVKTMETSKKIESEIKNDVGNEHDKLVINYELDINDRKHVLKIGDVNTYVAFGKYMINNSKELNDLYWLVAYKDEKRKKALLLTKYAIDCVPYNDKDEVITWQNSYAREWLNYDFYNLAFSEMEKKKIIKTFHTNSDEEFGGNDTYDNVFILSKNEVLEYMPYGNLACGASEYAISNKNALDEKGYGGSRYTNYLLRTPAQNGYSTMTVFTDGQMYDMKMINAKAVAIRPAIWVYYDDLDENVEDLKTYNNIARSFFLIATSNEENKIEKLNELPVTKKFKEKFVDIKEGDPNYYIYNLSQITKMNPNVYYSVGYDNFNRVLKLYLERGYVENKNEDPAILKEFMYRYYLDDGGYLDDIELLQVNDYFDDNNNRINGNVKFNKYNYMEILSYLIPGKEYYDGIDGLPNSWSDIIDSFSLTDKYRIMHDVKYTLFDKKELVKELLKNTYLNMLEKNNIDTDMFSYYGMDVVYVGDKDIFESFDDKKIILRLDVDHYYFYLDVEFDVVGDALDDISVRLIKATTVDEENENKHKINFVYGEINNKEEKSNSVLNSGFEINDTVDTVDIGKYYYYPDKYEPLTGKEVQNNLNLERYPIRWNVLKYDEKNGKALVITENIIDVKKFNDTDQYANWSNCSLREWLNGTFYNNSFSEEEKNSILTSTLVTRNSYDDVTFETNDRIFLLDINEVEEYFSKWKDRICKPTPYAQGMLPDKTHEFGMEVPGANDYLLRDFRFISANNGNDWGGNACDNGLRPAMWIKIGNVKSSDNIGYVIHRRYKTLINELFDKDIVLYDDYPVSNEFKNENAGGLFEKYELIDDDDHTYNIYVDTDRQAIKIVEYIARYDKSYYIGCKKGREINLMYSLDSKKFIDKIY